VRPRRRRRPATRAAAAATDNGDCVCDSWGLPHRESGARNETQGRCAILNLGTLDPVPTAGSSRFIKLMSTERETQPPAPPRVGLVLPGGGARAAYQVGVLRAIADLLPAKAANPFPVVTGTSAGAVNATAVAIHADRFRVAVGNLERVWRDFQVNQVFRADTASMLRSGLHWLLSNVGRLAAAATK